MQQHSTPMSITNEMVDAGQNYIQMIDRTDREEHTFIYILYSVFPRVSEGEQKFNILSMLGEKIVT